MSGAAVTVLVSIPRSVSVHLHTCYLPGLRLLLDPGSGIAPCLDEFLVGHARSLYVEQIYALHR
jgi:hypothetical protein